MSPPRDEVRELERRNVDICGSISVGSNEFADLLKLRNEKSSSSALDGDNTFSLSSFMEISLPESSRNQAAACLNSDKFLTDGDGDLSNSSLGLTRNFFNFMKNLINLRFSMLL